MIEIAHELGAFEVIDQILVRDRCCWLLLATVCPCSIPRCRPHSIWSSGLAFGPVPPRSGISWTYALRRTVTPACPPLGVECLLHLGMLQGQHSVLRKVWSIERVKARAEKKVG